MNNIFIYELYEYINYFKFKYKLYLKNKIYILFIYSFYKGLQYKIY